MILVVAAALVIIGTAWWVASPSVDQGFRHLFPKESRILLAAAILSTVITIAVSMLLPALTVIGGTVLAVALFVAWLRAALGRRRGEPPGDRSPVAWMRAIADRSAYQRRFDRYGPVFVGSQFGKPVVCIEGLERGQQLLREHREAIGPSPLAFTQQMMGDFLRYMDDDNHERYGPLFRRALSKELTESVRPVLAETAAQHLSMLDSQAVDLRIVLRPIVETAVLRTMFGIDPQEHQQFVDALRRFSNRSIQHRADRAARDGLDHLRALTRELLDPARRSVNECVLSALAELDPSMPDDIAIDNLLFMARLGTTNTTALVAWGFEHLATHPEFRPRLAAGDPEMADAFVFEVLRLSQSEYLYRRLTSDIEFEGYKLRRGWLVRLCIAEAHRDPSAFECPMDFTDRFVEERPPMSRFAPFGMDRHGCNSAGLVMMIVGTILSVAAADEELVWTASGTLGRDMRHWNHWRPGSGLEIRRATSANLAR